MTYAIIERDTPRGLYRARVLVYGDTTAELVEFTGYRSGFAVPHDMVLDSAALGAEAESKDGLSRYTQRLLDTVIARVERPGSPYLARPTRSLEEALEASQDLDLTSKG